MPKHFISLEDAKKSISRLRLQKASILERSFHEKDVLPRCETFARSAIEALLKTKDCQSVRIYYGMKEDHTIHAILVGVNSKNEDILPVGTVYQERSAGVETPPPPPILDEGIRCPDDCPPPSPLQEA